MLEQLTWIGVIVTLLGVLQVSGRAGGRGRRRVRPVTAVRDAMRGNEAGAVRAEFRRSGIQPPERRADSLGFGLP